MPIPQTVNVAEDLRDIVAEHERQWRKCAKCYFGNWASKHVFFRGTVPCDLLFIGEGPGREEDRIGVPFQGSAGGIFQKWVDGANEDIQFKWAVTNMVCCRPTDRPRGKNRAPDLIEQAKCAPRLDYFIQQIAKPRALVFMGNVAQQSDLASCTDLPTLYLRHPAYFLYSGENWRVQIEKVVAFAMEIMP